MPSIDGHRIGWLVLAALPACGGGGEGGGTGVVTVASVVITAPAAAPTFGALGRTVQFAAQARDAAGAAIAGKTVTWSSSNPGAASVSAGGLVTAIANGTASVTATVDGITAQLTVTVLQVVAAVAVTPVSPGPDTLKTSGRTRQFQANAVPGAVFAWSSSIPGVAGVGNTGLATAGTTDGTTNIMAASGGQQGTRALVVRRFAATFSISPSSANIATDNGTQLFTGAAQDSVGTNLPITWTSRNTGVATVAPASGVGGSTTTATAAGNGSTFVVLAGGTRSDSAPVTTSNQSVRFGTQVQPIFTANCAVAGCHTPPSLTAGMNLTAGAAYNNIVNVQSSQIMMLRVAPGDTVNSLLYRKITETMPPVGDRMPAGRPPLSAANIAIIRDWIVAGALNNAPPPGAARRP